MIEHLLSLIPEFDAELVFLEPWTVELEHYGWIMLMGFLVCLACGLVGNFVVVRRMALVGDAISHSLLPGIVITFLLTASLALPLMMLGAMIAGVVTTLLIELIHRKSRVKTDAALGIVFSLFFAIGVILINFFAGSVHIDAECVLYGELELLTLAPLVEWGSFVLGPQPLVVMAGVAFGVIVLLFAFYKELVVTSFDAGLAKSLGIPVAAYHYGLMAVLSLVIVSAFQAVGVILVIAMLIFPAATGAMLSDRLPIILAITVLLSALYAVLGVHLALFLDCSTAGAMVVVAGLLFGLAWMLSPTRSPIWKLFRTNQPIPLPE